MDDVPAWLRWSWYNQLPRDEAELRSFTRFYRGFPILNLVLGAVYLTSAFVGLVAFGRLDWLWFGQGVVWTLLGLWLLRRWQVRIALAREHVASLRAA